MMRRVFKGLARAAVALVAVALLGGVYVYVVSERELHRIYDVPAVASVHVPTDAASIAKGKRLAQIVGCFNSCHGKTLEGSTLLDDPGIAKINAPNVTRVLTEYNDAELERLLRRGVKKDGTTTWIMPSQMFTHLTDEDLGAVMAFVRSEPVIAGGTEREVTLRPLGRIGVATGKFKPLATTISPNARHAAVRDQSDPLKFGKYMVMTTCTECHGNDLRGDDFLKAPSLAVTAGYSPEDFRRLMRTGVAIGGRTLGLMTEVGVTRFPNLTEEEISAMQLYLDQLYKTESSPRAAQSGAALASPAG